MVDTGPWLGFKMAGNDFVGWIGGGTTKYDFKVSLELELDSSWLKSAIPQVWRHTCFSISRKSGKFKLVENGVKVWEKKYPEVIDWMKSISENARVWFET